MADEFEIFIHSIKRGNIGKAQFFFVEEFANKTDKFDLQPIHWASLCSNVDIVEWLLDEKCNIESLSKNGWRPIHFAVFVGDEEMVKFLIDNNCQLDCETDSGETISDVANGYCKHEFIYEILNEIDNLKFALSMRLKCDVNCDHKFCLTSVLRGKFYKGENIAKEKRVNVYKIRESQTDRIFAVKIINKFGEDSDDECDEPTLILPKLNQYLTKLNHENIVKYFGKIKIIDELNIFMEWMEKGSIYNEISKNGSLSVDKVVQYSKDILQAVAFLHHNEIIHRQIEPSQILIDNNEKCKLLISRFTCLWENDKINDETVTIKCDTINYMDPEIIINPYDYSSDILSVGATVIYMLTGRSQYHSFRSDSVTYNIETKKKLECSPCSISTQMQIFINDMTKPEPSDRATADELLNYELMKNISSHCEINNSNIDQSMIIDDSNINRESCRKFINNRKIGLSMELKCSDECEHEFCLSSATNANFKLNTIIGRGGFGSVFLIKESNSNRQFAVKTTIVVGDIANETKLFENNMNEYRDKLIQPNIVKYFGVLRNSQQLFIFMEYIDGGTLRRKIAENGNQPLVEETIKLYTKQILEGVRFLHTSKIIHRDIKSDNILLTKTGVIKLTDFGLSSILRTVSNNVKNSYCGTLNYMAPEIINGEDYNHLADIWSVGATVLEMASGKPPLAGYHEGTVLWKIGNEKKLDYPLHISNGLKTFLDLMIQGDPMKRQDAKTLLESNFLQ